MRENPNIQNSFVMPKTFGSIFNGKNNNFDLIRMVAATLVLFSHSFPLSGVRSWEPFLYYFGDYGTGGSWGVSIFFVVSGFLVTKSLLRNSLMNYILSRLLRIIPGLTVVTIVTVLFLGPCVTTESVYWYFHSAQTWRYLKNINVFEISQNLPGLFLSNPEAGSVNGSLWTLPIECGFYILLPILAVFNLLKPLKSAILLTGVFILYCVMISWWKLDWSNQGGVLFRGAPLYSSIHNFIFFFIGSMYWIFRDKITYSHGAAIIMTLLLYLFASTSIRFAALYVALPYLVFYFAFSRHVLLDKYRKLGDYSYGIYIYAYPVQQTIVSVGGAAVGPLRLFFIAAPVTLLFAVLSWRFVEAPALSLRKRLLQRQQAPEAIFAEAHQID